MNTKVIAKAIVFRADGKFLALRRSKTDIRRPLKWDFPGGMVDPGETFVEALIREIKEEAGLDVLKSDAQIISAKQGLRNDENIVWLFFVASIKNRPEVTLSHEHDKAEWMELTEGIKAYDYLIQKELLELVHEHQLRPASA
ncbi:MAG: NUDIX hydrolase [Candidatus Saccharimonadales bacterium]